MRVFVKPPAHLSRAMFRVENALSRYAPDRIQIVDIEDEAELVVLHVIGFTGLLEKIRELVANDQKYAVIQYCLRTTECPEAEKWLAVWQTSELVWSYYDLPQLLLDDGSWASEEGRVRWHFPFYHSPLGVDDAFRRNFQPVPRTVGAMTSGYVAGVSEAIEEVAEAVFRNNPATGVIHVGPKPEGLQKPLHSNWYSAHGVSDADLAKLYQSTQWVSGLRHGEGFELPALEGLCCGARPIVFDRPEMRQWYDGHAVFVPECYGEKLVERLVAVMDDPEPVTVEERANVLKKFEWKPIVQRFWERIK